MFIVFHSVLSSQPINGETSVLSLEYIPHDLSHLELHCVALTHPMGPIHSPALFLLLSGGITSGGRQEGLWAGLKQKGIVSIPLRLTIFFKKVLVCGHSLVVTLSLTISDTLKWLSLLPILMQESFWWWQCSDNYIISLSPPYSFPPPFPRP